MPTPLKSYIDRVLNVLAEIDDKGLDKKEIYKELAADGYDRSVVSQVVGHIRKKAAKPGKFAEQSQLFDIYLADYEGVGTVDATHTLHASSDERRPPSDKIEAALRTSERRAKSAGKEKPVDIASPDPSLSKAQGSHEPPTVAESAMVATEPATTAADDGGEGGEDAPALSADTQSQPERSEAPRQIEAGLVAKVEDQSTAARTDVRDSTEGIAAPQPLNPEAATTPPAAGRSPVDTHPEPGNGHVGETPASAGAPAAAGTAHNPIPAAVPGDGLYSYDWLRRHGRCLDQENCDPKPGKLCITCSRAMAVVPAGETIEHRGSIN